MENLCRTKDKKKLKNGMRENSKKKTQIYKVSKMIEIFYEEI